MIQYLGRRIISGEIKAQEINLIASIISIITLFYSKALSNQSVYLDLYPLITIKNKPDRCRTFIYEIKSVSVL